MIMVHCRFSYAILLVIFSAGISGQYEQCTGSIETINDGRCDTQNNIVECGFDGGDCCDCSCINDLLYPCGIRGYNCLDPDAVDDNGGNCQRRTASFIPCSPALSQTWFVDDTASATSLAEAINCSGGTFDVRWSGSVTINHTIAIRNGTTVYVNGEGSGAEINGGREIRLFTVEGSILHIHGLILSDGNATYGGAIAATSSSVFLNKTSSKGNIASSYGGAVYVGRSSTITWNGQTTFTLNYGGRGGGAVAISTTSTAIWNGPTIFSNNTAAGDEGFGGAVFVTSQNTVSWVENTSFLDNFAYSGGAVYINRCSSVSWRAKTLYHGNKAGGSGGAVSIKNSSVLWTAETSFTNNTANRNGGAVLFLESSSAWWCGKTSFVENTAYFGGATIVDDRSIASWDGETSFVANDAGYGGAVYVNRDSIASWTAESLFVNNSAKTGRGGALRVRRGSFVSWVGNTSFTGNSANTSGGAIYISTGSNMTVGGYTRFLNNDAALHGGAIYVYVGFGQDFLSYFLVDSNTAMLLRGNKCGVNGGGIALVGAVVTSLSHNIMFLENHAEVAGGAVYLSGVSFGPQFNGTKFYSNYAEVGGGVYSTGSGIGTVGDEDENSDQNPTTFMGCEFVENEASTTGGAVNTGAGIDMIENTYFVRNTAPIGGALRLVGTASLLRCTFIDNLSNQAEGPGVFNDGMISEASDCSFVGNVFNCDQGSYLEYNETDALFDTICKGCDIQCKGCIIKGKEPMCVGELDHSSSSGGNTTIELLAIDQGYWRATNTSMDIFACYNAEACVGGVTGSESFCRKGYKGPYCSICNEGYVTGLGFACTKCSDNMIGGIAIAVGVSVVFLFAFVAYISYMLSGKSEVVDNGIVARISRFVPLQSVKVVIVVWQILTQFSTVANVVFPSMYQDFLDSVDIINFDLSWVVSVGCVVITDFHDQLLFATLGPLVLMATMGITYITAMRINGISEDARRIVRRKHVSMVLLLTFLVYSPVSSTLFKMFACDNLEDDQRYLRTDYRIHCDTSKHIALQIYSGSMVILYVFGIPAFYGVLLFNNREVLLTIVGREEDESVKPIADLWKPYRPKRFYYEVIECMRRVLLTGVLVFIFPNTAGQIAVALIIATFFLALSEALAPHASLWDTWCSRTGHAIVFMSIFLALLLKVDVSEERASSQRIFEIVLVVAHSVLVLIVVIEAVAMVLAMKEGMNEDAEPRICPNLTVSPSGVSNDLGLIVEGEAVPHLRERVRSI